MRCAHLASSTHIDFEVVKQAERRWSPLFDLLVRLLIFRSLGTNSGERRLGKQLVDTLEAGTAHRSPASESSELWGQGST